MATPDDVMGELVNNSDLIVMYDGAQGMFTGAGLRTGSLRYMVKQVIWDLLRFQKPASYTVIDPTVPWGLRDMVSAIFKMTYDNNVMLKQLVAQLPMPTNVAASTTPTTAAKE